MSAARCKAQGRDPYPDDDTLVALFRNHRTIQAVAQSLGRKRESLRDYLLLRPDLRDLCWEAGGRAFYRSERDHDAWKAERARRYALRWYDTDNREYADIVRRDPCSFCGFPMPVPGDLDLRNLLTLDHIEPRARWGEEHWTNYTGACSRCNGEKNAVPLLLFMLARLPRRSRRR